MRLSRLGMISAIILQTVAATAAVSDPPQSISTPSSELDVLLPPLMKRTLVPAVAVAAIAEGEMAWTRTYGQRASDAIAGDDTVFNVASLTKPVFSMMVLGLIANGSLALDEPLSKYWADPDIADDPRRNALTPRIVLSHQTGLQNWRGHDPLTFSFDPGSRHEYSGEGFEYLRRAIERKTGQPMQALMRKHVLDPAGFEASFGWDDGLRSRAAAGFDESGRVLDMRSLHQSRPNAAAAMFTTVGDYGRFVAWVVGGGGLPDDLFRQMQHPQALHEEPAETFGLGWKLARAEGSAAALWHDGREAGVRTLAIARPAKRDGLVVLTNSSNGELVMRAVVTAVLEDGEALLRKMDRDTWHALESLSGVPLGRILQVISRSPSFMSTLLHAADTVLVQASPLGDTHKSALREAIDRFVMAMLEGRAGPQEAERLLAQLLEPGEGVRRLRRRFDAREAQAWIDAVGAGDVPAAAGPGAVAAVREVVEVPERVLAEYAGVYLVPSSQLRITIVAKKGRLLAQAPGMPDTIFYPASERLFFMKESATDFEFVREENGRVSGLRIIWDGKRSELAGRLR